MNNVDSSFKVETRRVTFGFWNWLLLVISIFIFCSGILELPIRALGFFINPTQPHFTQALAYFLAVVFGLWAISRLIRKFKKLNSTQSYKWIYLVTGIVGALIILLSLTDIYQHI
jgi:branched-subunit amino acid transport protein